jgi:hypothetical protein
MTKLLVRTSLFAIMALPLAAAHAAPTMSLAGKAISGTTSIQTARGANETPRQEDRRANRREDRRASLQTGGFDASGVVLVRGREDKAPRGHDPR